MSFIAKYRSADPARWLLGGVKESESSRWSHREDAESYLAGVKSTHANLATPLVVEGEVVESALPAQIIRRSEEHNGVKFCSCPGCIRVYPAVRVRA